MKVTHGLRRALQVNPGGVSTVFEDRVRTWADTGDRVARLAGALRGSGLRTGDRIAVLSLNSDRYFELYLAVAWAGAVIVPLNTRWACAENEDALRDCRATFLFVDKAFLATGQTLIKNVPMRLFYADDDRAPAGVAHYEDLMQHEPVADTVQDGNDLAGIFYTGGTTGRSKGVMLSHGNLTANALNALSEGLFADSSIYVHAAPMFHLADGAATYTLILSGGASVIVRAFSTRAVMQAIERYRGNEVLLVPTMIQMLVDDPSFRSHDASSLRRVVYAASPMNEALLDRATAALPHAEFVQLYGMTELSPIATTLHWRNHIGEARDRGLHRAAGRATLGCEIRIVDSNDCSVPTGVFGEIVARGDNVMLGYWERPEETAAALAGGWMHTGDGGYMDSEGFVYIVDRVKDMIISGGENVYCVEVENVVAQHPAVAQCAVIGVPSKKWGESVHAFVVTLPGAHVAAEDIIGFCKERIAGYKCPQSFDISDGPLPMSGAGKILKRELRQRFWQNSQGASIEVHA